MCGGHTAPQATQTGDEHRHLEEPVQKKREVSACATCDRAKANANGGNVRLEHEEAPEPRVRVQLRGAKVPHRAPDERVRGHVDVEAG